MKLHSKQGMQLGPRNPVPGNRDQQTLSTHQLDWSSQNQLWLSEKPCLKSTRQRKTEENTHVSVLASPHTGTYVYTFTHHKLPRHTRTEKHKVERWLPRAVGKLQGGRLLMSYGSGRWKVGGGDVTHTVDAHEATQPDFFKKISETNTLCIWVYFPHNYLGKKETRSKFQYSFPL